MKQNIYFLLRLSNVKQHYGSYTLNNSEAMKSIDNMSAT